jgi:hypothetical protein
MRELNEMDTLNVDSKLKHSEAELWVEKFRPKDFFELLSDDVTEFFSLIHSDSDK